MSILNQESDVTLDETTQAGTTVPAQAAPAHAGRPPALALEGVDVTFGSFTAVTDANLEVREGEFLCLLGPSGCGKSTLLSIMAGFHTPAAGVMRRSGEQVTRTGRDVGFVFQNSEALFDWLTVEENVGFGPRMAKMDKAAREAVVAEHLRLVGLENAAKKRPPQLSGGMRQRVQIARVLANEPEVVLMDEPFGALDAQTRTVLQQELDRIWRERQCTVVFVTHDIDEALVLSDRIAVMTAGPSARIKSVYDVNLDRPRNDESPEYIALRHQVRDDIAEEVARSLGVQAGARSATKGADA